MVTLSAAGGVSCLSSSTHRAEPLFDGPVTRRYLTRKQTRGLTEVGALAPSEREGELKYYTDFTSALQAENLIFSAW